MLSSGLSIRMSKNERDKLLQVLKPAMFSGVIGEEECLTPIGALNYNVPMCFAG